jgi:hypothetical protein
MAMLFFRVPEMKDLFNTTQKNVSTVLVETVTMTTATRGDRYVVVVVVVVVFFFFIETSQWTATWPADGAITCYEL